MEKRELWCRILLFKIEQSIPYEQAISIADKVVSSYEQRFDNVTSFVSGERLMNIIEIEKNRNNPT